MLSRPDVLRRTGGRAVAEIIYDEATIAAKVKELGAAITAHYTEGELVVLGLLKGSFIFLGDLVRQIERPLQVDFLVASSYGVGTVSSGEVRLLYDPRTQLEGKHILLLEDIIDSGVTLERLLTLLGSRSPRSLAVCALLDKGLVKEPRPEMRFVGFRAPLKFLVGYGLDHAEEFRHLPYIVNMG